MALEIERKFHIHFKKGLSFLITSNYKKEEIIQSYIERSEEKEVRVRKITEYTKSITPSIKRIYFTKTTKYGEGFKREEFEDEISEEEYTKELDTSIASLKKIRFTLQDKSECFDWYPFVNLITFEKEFETEEDALNYVIPKSLQYFILDEITGNKDFSNYRLAKFYETLRLED